jgi:hypothetical protein
MKSCRCISKSEAMAKSLRQRIVRRKAYIFVR